MAMQDEGTGAERPNPVHTRKKVSPARNAIGAVLLVALSAVAYLEWDANRRAAAGTRRLNEALAREEADLLTMDQVEALLGRKPDGPGVVEGLETRVVYTWRG